MFNRLLCCSFCGNFVFPLENILSNSRFLRNQKCFSTVKIRELRPLQKVKKLLSQEEIEEEQFTELKLSLGMLNGNKVFGSEQILLVHPHVKWGSGSAPKNAIPELEVEEAQTLCQTIPGFKVVSSIIVNTDYNVRSKLIWGSGRLDAIVQHKQHFNISALMINVDSLSPLQLHELTKYFGLPIYDRLTIVLSIFKMFARTKEAKLQIALAEIPFIRSHIKFLNHSGEHLSNDKIPVQSSAPMFPNIDRLEGSKQLEFLRLKEHKIQNKAKQGPGKTPVIGVIGYTNSGKTTFIKKLTDSSILLGENRLFATLDSSTHLSILPSTCKVYFADTIGFISNLPIKLLASFSATLQHVENSDLLIHIMDLSHPDLLAQRDNVFETLNKLKIDPNLINTVINVGNKLDKCDDERREKLTEMGIFENLFSISCRTLEGLPHLIKEIDKKVQLLSGSSLRRLRLSHDSKIVQKLYKEGYNGIPSECGNYLTFDLLMNNEQFSKFHASLGLCLRRKGEEEEKKIEEWFCFVCSAVALLFCFLILSRLKKNEKDQFLKTLMCLNLIKLPIKTSDNTRQLKYVHAIWRHGDRAPKRKPYEDDIYDLRLNEKYWPRGWNQLTNLGMLQMQQLGKFLRERYVGSFLSNNFDRNEFNFIFRFSTETTFFFKFLFSAKKEKKNPLFLTVFIRSSSVDRAIESAQSLLSGLFPPSTDEKFDDTLNWQPIPVHTGTSKIKDPLLRPSSFACPKYEQLWNDISGKMEKELLEKYKELVEELRPILKFPENKQIRLRDITELKRIQMEVNHNLSQPEWVFKIWPQYENKTTLELIIELRDSERIAEFNSHEKLSRLSGGYLLGDWLGRMKQLVNTNQTKEALLASKMVLYSAHDGTLLALLSALQINSTVIKIPPFASCLIAELYSDGNDYQIELLYRRNGELENLAVGNCGTKCPLIEFEKYVENRAIFGLDMLYQECGTPRCVFLTEKSSATK
ncbi:putative GTP-binding protein 6 [Meloidogyne graminicola]|uniref:Putative GTP-binding protein 6 n=1 Tax=Meloidogyne graminicola TaxID=189291 RepID=A0A8T0A3N9_9BILA|nr:putative GTP-binding protein 6 [Meloidogyne graminicola]